MSLEPYRRHNEGLCNSTDTIKCANPRRPCPIWVSGTGPDGKFIRQSLRKVTGTITRDWAAASKAIRDWEENGKAPKPENAKATIQQLRDDFTTKVEGENLTQTFPMEGIDGPFIRLVRSALLPLLAPLLFPLICSALVYYVAVR